MLSVETPSQATPYDLFLHWGGGLVTLIGVTVPFVVAREVSSLHLVQALHSPGGSSLVLVLIALPLLLALPFIIGHAVNTLADRFNYVSIGNERLCGRADIAKPSEWEEQVELYIVHRTGKVDESANSEWLATVYQNNPQAAIKTLSRFVWTGFDILRCQEPPCPSIAERFAFLAGLLRTYAFILLFIVPFASLSVALIYRDEWRPDANNFVMAWSVGSVLCGYVLSWRSNRFYRWFSQIVYIAIRERQLLEHRT